MNSHGQFIDMHMAWEKFPFVMLGILDTKWKNLNNDGKNGGDSITCPLPQKFKQ